MSLTPIARILLSDYEDKLAVKIMNTGVGPLIIGTFQATRGNETENDLISLCQTCRKGMLWNTSIDDLDGGCLRPVRKANTSPVDW